MTDKSGLISRIVDRDDGPDDWAAFDTLAGSDPNTYQDLLHALRDDALVRQSVAGHLAVADRVGLPVPAARSRFGLAPILLAASGWMAALVIGLVWLGGAVSDGDRDRDQRPGLPLVRHDTFVSRVDSQAADIQPMPEPSLGELPYLLVEARRIPGSGNVEVFYVRRTLERTVVSDAYRIAFDDGGQPVAVPTDLNAYIPGRIY